MRTRLLFTVVAMWGGCNSPTYLSEQLEALSQDDRVVLASAQQSSGELRGFLVDLEHPGAAESLADRGWLYRIFAAAGPLRGEVFVLPDELQSVLPEPKHAEVLDASEPPPAQRRSSDPAFSLFALISALTRVGGRLEEEVRAWSEPRFVVAGAGQDGQC